MSRSGKKMFDDVSTEDDGSPSSSLSSLPAAKQTAKGPAHVDPASNLTPPPAAAAAAAAVATAAPPAPVASTTVGTPPPKTPEPDGDLQFIKAAQTPAGSVTKGGRYADGGATAGTPATVSKYVAREEREVAAFNAQHAATTAMGDEPAYQSPAQREAYAKRLQQPVDDAVVTTRAAQQQQQQQRSHAYLAGATDSDADCDSGETCVFRQYVAPYLLPRLDPDLAGWDDPERERVLPGGKADAIRADPPTCVESCCGYLLATDRRLSLYLLLVCLAIVFTIVSIPTSQVDLTSKALLDELATGMVLTPDNVYNLSTVANVSSCYTYWGYKENCDAGTYTLPVSLMWCESIRSRLQAAAAFSIITLAIYALLLIMTVIVLFCLTESPRIRQKNRRKNTKARWVIGSVGFICFFTHIISWGAIADIYNSHHCAGQPTDPSRTVTVRIDDTNKAYGVGFGLTLTAWCLHTAALVQLLALPYEVMNKGQR